MGKGFAASLRAMYPRAYAVYKEHHGRFGLELGKIVPAHCGDMLIVNALTQDDYWVPGAPEYKVYVDYDAVRSAFKDVAKYAKYEERHVHYPMIGAGLAKGNWDVIANIINEELEGLPHTLWKL